MKKLLGLLLAFAVIACSDAPPRYTAHPPSRSDEIYTLRILDGFSIGERAKIMRAVNEWNFALNGVARFEIVDAPEKAGWIILASDSYTPNRPGDYPIAETMGSGEAGVLMVFLNRLGNKDLGMVVMHELGHVLGIGHQPHGLMSTHYRFDEFRCIDDSTIAALAQLRGLPMERFNWCQG
jgi:hypothetical protein